MSGGMIVSMIVAGVIALALLAALVLSAVWLARDLARGRGRGPRAAAPTAREVLDQLYAAGEIDADERARRLSTLSR